MTQWSPVKGANLLVDPRAAQRKERREQRYPAPPVPPVEPCVEIKFYGAFVLNRRVVLHAIDAVSYTHLTLPTTPYV